MDKKEFSVDDMNPMDPIFFPTNLTKEQAQTLYNILQDGLDNCPSMRNKQNDSDDEWLEEYKLYEMCYFKRKTIQGAELQSTPYNQIVPYVERPKIICSTTANLAGNIYGSYLKSMYVDGCMVLRAPISRFGTFL